MLLCDAIGKYSPDQPRDDHGRWGEGAVYYRGTTPGATERIRTGSKTWDDHLFVTEKPENARMNGRSIERVEMKPDAKILREGTREFRNVAGSWHKNESLLAYATRASEQAKAKGYDAIHFKSQTDVGTAIMNTNAIASRSHYKDYE